MSKKQKSVTLPGDENVLKAIGGTCLLPCTHKWLQNDSKRIEGILADTAGYDFHEVETFRQRITNNASILLGKKIVPPPAFNGTIQRGTIFGLSYKAQNKNIIRYMDDVSVGPSSDKSIIWTSEFGKILQGKQAGDSFSFNSKEKDVKIEVMVTFVGPYEALKEFFEERDKRPGALPIEEIKKIVQAHSPAMN